jgi:hypothetical protein
MMAREVIVPWDTTRQGHLLHDLIQRQGLAPGAYALFFVEGEGELHPDDPAWDDIEAESGYVIDTTGTVHAFWLAWDEARGGPALTEWEEIAPEPAWRDDPEYQGARRAVGLPAA